MLREALKLRGRLGGLSLPSVSYLIVVVECCEINPLLPVNLCDSFLRRGNSLPPASIT